MGTLSAPFNVGGAEHKRVGGAEHEHVGGAEQIAVKDTLNTMPGGELK